MADVEKSGAVFKVLAAKDPITWNKLSFWNKAEDTQFEASDRLPDANNTVQFRLGDIYGITSSPGASDDGICASSYLVNNIIGELAVFNIQAGDWSTATVHIGESDYLYRDFKVKEIILNQPLMYLTPYGGTSPIPTDDEKEIFTNIEMITIGDDTLRFLIEDKPDIGVSIGVKGVVQL